MKNKKGGYTVKNNFYIKTDCKNNEFEETVDEQGYILDPLTYDRIIKGNIIQLSDGFCYNKSKNLKKSIKNRDTLPFGHPVTIMDEAKLSSSEKSLSSDTVSTPSPLSSPPYSSERSLSSDTVSTPLPLNSSPERLIELSPELENTSFVIPPQPNISGFTAEWNPPSRTYILRRNQVEVQTPRRRGRPPGSRNRISVRNNTGRGSKNKSNKSNKYKK